MSNTVVYKGNQDLSVDVITIDGGAGTGKGTARREVALALGFHQLDSGVPYRAVGWLGNRLNLMDNERALALLAEDLELRMDGDTIFLADKDLTAQIRSDEAAAFASRVAKMQLVRDALLDLQLCMRKAPGLVADGRDQGLIFNTPFRFFFITSPEIRAKRRVLEFQGRGQTADYEGILAGILERDEQDQRRTVNPLAPHPEAVIIDTSYITVAEVANRVIDEYYRKKAALAG